MSVRAAAVGTFVTLVVLTHLLDPVRCGGKSKGHTIILGGGKQHKVTHVPVPVPVCKKAKDEAESNMLMSPMSIVMPASGMSVGADPGSTVVHHYYPHTHQSHRPNHGHGHHSQDAAQQHGAASWSNSIQHRASGFGYGGGYGNVYSYGGGFGNAYAASHPSRAWSYPGYGGYNSYNGYPISGAHYENYLHQHY